MKYMSKRSVFLWGIFVGQLLMLPTLYSWIKHPVVEAIPIPVGVFKQIPYRKYIMHDVPHLAGGKKDLTVFIAGENDVREIFKSIYGEYDPGLMGFYNPNTHTIVCVANVDILVHEMRHVFEGAFHRGAQNAHIDH